MERRFYYLVLFVFTVFTLSLGACSTDAYSDNDAPERNNEERNAMETNSPDGQTSSDLNYEVGNRGASAYVFNSTNLTNAENPNLILKRGSTYTFSVNAPGHPFLIKSVRSASNTNTYNNGVSNNGAETGTITFTVPADAPDTLYYVCEFHASMSGVLRIED